MLIDSARYNIKYVININALRKRFITAVYTTECTVQLYPVHHFTDFCAENCEPNSD